jgi:hypothetical protein
MKVTGTGGPTSPTAMEGVDEAGNGGTVQATADASAPGLDPVSLLAQQIESGAVTSQHAVGQLVEMVMGEKGVAGLPDSVRADLRAALDVLGEEDPYVADLLAGMSTG